MRYYYQNPYLEHKDHKYIDKIKTGINKWKYIYDYNITGKGYKRDADNYRKKASSLESLYSTTKNNLANARKKAESSYNAYQQSRKEFDNTKQTANNLANRMKYKNQYSNEVTEAKRYADALSKRLTNQQKEVQKNKQDYSRQNEYYDHMTAVNQRRQNNAKQYTDLANQAERDSKTQTIGGKTMYKVGSFAESVVSNAKKGLGFARNYLTWTFDELIDDINYVYDEIQVAKQKREVEKIKKKPITELSGKDIALLYQDYMSKLKKR